MSEETDQTVYQRLAAPFELSDHAKVPKGGMTQTYAPWTAYVERLNDVLGADHWSFRVIREGFTETECWVLGEIMAIIDDQLVVRQQYGCEPITKGQRETPTTDLLKTAASDAIKKAASLIGPGLYLSIKEERVEIERAMQEAIYAAAAEKRAQQGGKVEAAARITGAPPKQESPREALLKSFFAGKAYAIKIGLDPENLDPGALSDDELTEVVDALREQCQYVLDRQKQAKAKREAEQQAAAS